MHNVHIQIQCLCLLSFLFRKFDTLISYLSRLNQKFTNSEMAWHLTTHIHKHSLFISYRSPSAHWQLHIWSSPPGQLHFGKFAWCALSAVWLSRHLWRSNVTQSNMHLEAHQVEVAYYLTKCQKYVSCYWDAASVSVWAHRHSLKRIWKAVLFILTDNSKYNISSPIHFFTKQIPWTTRKVFIVVFYDVMQDNQKAHYLNQLFITFLGQHPHFCSLLAQWTAPLFTSHVNSTVT